MQRAQAGSSQQFTIKKKVSWFGFWFVVNVCVVNRKISRNRLIPKQQQKREEKHTCMNLIFQPSKAIDSDDDTPVLEGKQAQKIAITFLLPFFCAVYFVVSRRLSPPQHRGVFRENIKNGNFSLVSLCVVFLTLAYYICFH